MEGGVVFLPKKRVAAAIILPFLQLVLKPGDGDVEEDSPFGHRNLAAGVPGAGAVGVLGEIVGGAEGDAATHKVLVTIVGALEHGEVGAAHLRHAVELRHGVGRSGEIHGGEVGGDVPAFLAPAGVDRIPDLYLRLGDVDDAVGVAIGELEEELVNVS